MTPFIYMLRMFALLAAFVAVPTAALRAQTVDAALLVADSVLITNQNRLVATGNVEAYYQGTRLFTDKIIYDQTRDELIFESEIRLSQANGDVFIADSADLDSKLENGILRGARYVMAQELQILSAQTDRVAGRYTVMRKVIASSCQICGGGPPIWQIRSTRAIHDREEKQIYFKHAQFRILGVPVLYLPRLRIPDPSLKRTSGFLVPKLVSDTVLGTGIKIPYFKTLGDHADVTLTPFYTPVTRTLEYRFRKMFRRGYVEFNGAVSDDDLLPGELRSYLNGFGSFDLGEGYIFDFDIETSSDSGYRSIYGYSGRDRLGSAFKLTRTKRDVFFQTEVFNFETLRDSETNRTQPTVVGDLVYERRYRFPNLQGEVRATLDLHGHRRVSVADVIGRDMSRTNVDLYWGHTWTVGRGLRFGLTGNLAIDQSNVIEDAANSGRRTTVAPTIAASLRYPLRATGADGATHVVEPLAQFAWTGGSPSTLPNDESVSAEFDEGNLLALSRFPAKDRRETGAVAAIGLRWERAHASKWTGGLAIGQVFRAKSDPSFTTSSGLGGVQSDTLLALNFAAPWGASFQARGIFDKSFQPTKAEARFGYTKNKFGLSGNYVQLKADPAENRALSVAEWSLSSYYAFNQHWTTTASWQYDLLTNRTANTGAGVSYQNECLSVSFTAARSFAASTALVPATTYELAIALLGFSTGGSGKGARRTCRK